jgi:hypothetical protein
MNVGTGWIAEVRCAGGRLFRDLGDVGEQRWRDRQAERLRGLQVDGKVELSRLLNRYVGGLRAPENAIDVTGRALVLSRKSDP